MIDSKKIFIDTAPIIYYLQSSELYYANKYDDERICREWMYNET